MAIRGIKQLTYRQRQELFRKTPRDIRAYTNPLTKEYNPLIESFTVDDYHLYEKLLHAYKRTDALMNYCQKRNVQGPVLEMATIRSQDLKLHQKLVQVLRHRWTDIQAKKTEALNQDPNKFWFLMSGQIQRRSRDEGIKLHPDWEGKQGREKLIQFLKDQFEKQNGTCAVSKETMTLTVGVKTKNTNKCSPDRKDSNKGYTPNNIWFVAWWVNAMKMDMTMDTFWKRVDVLHNAREQVQ